MLNVQTARHGFLTNILYTKATAQTAEAITEGKMTREEAISRINNDLECHKKELSAAYKTALNMAIEALQEQKKGRWISQAGGGYCCSKCGRYALHDVDGKFALLFVKSKYCPNCGADMRGEE